MAVTSKQTSIPIFGDRESGADVRAANVTAVSAVSNILKSTLGPQGLDKMIVDEIGEVTISNDGATILRQLEIQHPAARLLVDLADLQDKEVGDGTTSVVLIACELLRRAQTLVQNGIHPTSIIAGYKLAMKESVRYIRESVAMKSTILGSDMLRKIAMTSFGSKIGTDDTIFGDMVVDALQNVKVIDGLGNVRHPYRAVNILKCHGQGRRDSVLVDGYALGHTFRVSQGMPISVKDAKIAILDFNLKQHRLQLGVQVQVESPEELEKIRQKEKDVTKSSIAKILASGANVIVTSQGIDDMSAKYFVEAKAFAVRRVPPKDLRRIAKATGGTVVTSMSTFTATSDDASLDEQVFDKSWLGSCKEVCEDKVGDWDFVFFKSCKSQKAQTIILRGPNDFMLDELERSMHDALCAVSRTLESNSICPGGGAVEAALDIYLEDFARTLGSREQLPVAEFANALLIIPRTLAVNAALDAAEMLARLCARHYTEQHSNEAANTVLSDAAKIKCFGWGLDLRAGTVRNSFDSGVLEPAMTKIKAIRFATEAAVTVLRIDDVIKLHPEPEPERNG